MRALAWSLAGVLGVGAAVAAATAGVDPEASVAGPVPGAPVGVPGPREAPVAPGANPVGPTLQQEYNAPYDGRFTFARIRFEAGPGGMFALGSRGEPPWAHDYPRAERNLMKILDEVSLLAPYMDGGNVYDLDDPGLMRHPVAYVSEPGYWTMTEEEAELLRGYLLKGGFLIFDDFRGRHWYNFVEQLRRVLPGVRPLPLDVSHPIFHSFFDVKSLAFDHDISYRGFPPEYYGIFEDNDPSKRLMGVANYNNDIGEYWEFSDEGFLPIELSNEAYKLGVNYIMYALTH